MKRNILTPIAVVLSLSSVCIAQQAPVKKLDTNNSSTKLESFLGKRGTLLIRDFYDLGILSKKRNLQSGDESVKQYSSDEELNNDKTDGNFTIDAETISMNAITVYEPGDDKNKVKGLQIRLYKYARSGSDSSSSFVDVDEARSLSKAIEYLVTASTKPKGENVGSREVKFSTRNDFVVTLSQSDRPSAYVSGGTVGVTTIKLLSVDELNAIKSMVDNGIIWLEKQ